MTSFISILIHASIVIGYIRHLKRRERGQDQNFQQYSLDATRVCYTIYKYIIYIYKIILLYSQDLEPHDLRDSYERVPNDSGQYYSSNIENSNYNNNASIY